MIPQEAGLNERAVSFTKGCYVGQETVARLYYRGKPNRHLRGLRLSAPVEPGKAPSGGLSPLRTARLKGTRRGSSGSAGVVVFDYTVSIPEALMVVARFYAHESCGQCTPCRESTGWIYKMCRRIVDGKARKDDLDTILDVAKRGAGTTICAFYDGAVGPYISYIEKFRAEFEALVEK